MMIDSLQSTPFWKISQIFFWYSLKKEKQNYLGLSRKLIFKIDDQVGLADFIVSWEWHELHVAFHAPNR